jgi:hypothetical protein
MSLLRPLKAPSPNPHQVEDPIQDDGGGMSKQNWSLVVVTQTISPGTKVKE